MGNGENYPDIHSVLRLSLLFNTSLDQLIKGDIEIMKIEIKEIEIRKINKISYMYAFLLILTLISFVPFIALMGWYGLIPWVILYAITIYVALKAEKVKKANNLSTYREIVAFMEGKQLDEVEKQQEIGKRPYQKVLYMFGSAAMALIIFYLMTKIFLL